MRSIKEMGAICIRTMRKSPRPAWSPSRKRLPCWPTRSRAISLRTCSCPPLPLICGRHPNHGLGVTIICQRLAHRWEGFKQGGDRGEESNQPRGLSLRRGEQIKAKGPRKGGGETLERGDKARGGRRTGIASQALLPGETPMGALCPRDEF